MLPKIKYNETKKVARTEYFGGLNLTDMLKEGELTDCSGLTGERAPFLSPRYADLLAHTFGVPRGMTAADGKLYVAADTDLWSFDGTTATRVMTGLTQTKKSFAFVGGALCVFPDKRWYRPATSESGSLEHTETFTGFTLTENSLTRTDGADFGFKVNDGVALSGAGLSAGNRVSAVVTGVSGSALTFAGAPFTAETGNGSVTVSRLLPDLEFVCEHDNRLWGVAGNRVYASWLGDPTNFYAYDTSHAQASYFADVGSGGAFTGVASCPSYVAFMKADRVHKLYGSKPSNYRLTSSSVNGCEAGSGASVFVVNDNVVYNGADGLYAYNGGEPEYLSAKTGRLGSDAAAVCMNGVVYVAATKGGVRKLFTYDLRRERWLCDGVKDVYALAVCAGSVWYLTSAGKLYELGGGDTVCDWSATLAPFVENAETRRYVRVRLKIWLAEGASVKVTADNGSGKESIYLRRADEDRRYELPLPLYTGSALRVSLSGSGKCLIKGVIREFIE
ncbi:MAG: hypothetical protein IKS88_00985 [Clostridia bacterium]|nr:hypothetical protein [Clostridia bacterium]